MTEENTNDAVVEPVEATTPEPETPAEAVEADTVASVEATEGDAPAEAAPAEDAVEQPAETAETTGETAEAIDPARKAELDALAAELAGGAVTKPAKRSRRVTAKDPAAFKGAEATKDAEAAPVVEPVETTAPEGTPVETADSETEESAEGADEAQEGTARSRSRRGRNRSRSGEKPEGQQSAQGGNGQNGQAQPADGDEDRSARGRDRNRKRGQGGRLGDDLEPEILPDDVLIPIAGILDVLDNYAFVRTTGYLPGVTDVYVSLGQVKKYGLRKGDAVVGSIRQPREGEQQGRQKYNALVKVDSINGQTADASLARPEFAGFTPVRPAEAIALKTTAKAAFAKGQRALVVGGSGSGKTTLVAEVAESISGKLPEAHLMVILAGARPEEATEFRRKVKGEVIVSTFDQSAEDLVTVAELAVERAKRLVELGLDVVVLIDSITQLGRAYFSLAPVSRAHADDPTFLLPAKRLFGAARDLEDAASLTIVATGSADVAIDQLVVSELSSVANAVVKL